jgi:hypothetical protein
MTTTGPLLLLVGTASLTFGTLIVRLASRVSAAVEVLRPFYAAYSPIGHSIQQAACSNHRNIL